MKGYPIGSSLDCHRTVTGALFSLSGPNLATYMGNMRRIAWNTENILTRTGVSRAIFFFGA